MDRDREIEKFDRLFMRVLKKDGQTAAIRAVVEAAQKPMKERVEFLENEVNHQAYADQMKLLRSDD